VKPAGAAARLGWDLTHRGPSAWALAALLSAFYVVLYFTDALDGPARALGLDGKWTLYGLLYTIAMVGGGAHVLSKYRRDRYQVVRTLSVVLVQVVFAFALPHLLVMARQPEFYFSYLWPLKVEYFYPSTIGAMPWPFLAWSLLGSLVLVPVLSLRYGKRWYCSWVCGCGGLASTAGDPFRHLSDKSERSWRFERVAIHLSLAVTVVVTALVVVTSLWPGKSPALAHAAGEARAAYALVVSAILSGVVGVGLYPLGGTRVWCRFFCPMAALLGLLQKAGRFRIRVKPDMCISCGLCSTYCEMGIDVRSYAQQNRSFTRASCVGCGLCAQVCPRGVLVLEAPPRAGAAAQLVQIRVSR